MVLSDSEGLLVLLYRVYTELIYRETRVDAMLSM